MHVYTKIAGVEVSSDYDAKNRIAVSEYGDGGIKITVYGDAKVAWVDNTHFEIYVGTSESRLAKRFDGSAMSSKGKYLGALVDVLRAGMKALAERNGQE